MPSKGGKKKGGGGAVATKSDSSGFPPEASCAPSCVHFLDEDSKLMCITYPSIEALNLALGRLSCFAENKQHKGKYIPLSKWREMPSTSGMVYEGHNFPSSVVKEWIGLAPEGDYAPSEKALIDACMARRVLTRDKKGRWAIHFTYLIAGVEGDTETFRHEAMHALYFEHEPYRGLVSAVFQSDLPAHLLSFIKTYICSKGYSPDVTEDEFQAYLCCDDHEVVGGKKNAGSKQVTGIKERLRGYQKGEVSWQEGWVTLMLEGTAAGMAGIGSRVTPAPLASGPSIGKRGRGR